jgi:Flp pilus assembly protein TadD
VNARRLPLAASVALAAACLGLYGWTLGFPFQFDDHLYLVTNPLLRDARSFAFAGDFAAFATRAADMGLDPDLSTNLILRPLCYLTFYAHHVFGGLRPEPMRAVNILIHIANALLVFTVLLRLLRMARPDPPTPASATFIATFAASLFAVNPMQTESVTYIVQRFTSLGTFFYLLTWLLHLRGHAAEGRAGRTAARAGAFLSLVAGMLTKEFLVTAPVVLVLADVLVLGLSVRTALRRSWLLFLALPIVPVMVLLTSWAQAGAGAGLKTAMLVAAPLGAGEDFQYRYAISQPGVVLDYLRLFVVPYGLNLDHGRDACASVSEAAVLLPVAGILVLLAGAWWWRRRDPGRARGSLVLFGTLWFFLTLGVDSSVIPLPDLMSEHRAYLPSVGLSAVMAGLLDAVRARCAVRPLSRRAVLGAAAAWIAVLGGLTVARNRVWASEAGMWRDVVARSPGNARAWMNLGVALAGGDDEEAVACLYRAIAINPAALLARINLARVLIRRGRPAEALSAVDAGLALSGGDAALFFERGSALRALGDLEGAIEAFRHVCAMQPGNAMAPALIGELHLRQGRREEALASFRAAAMLDPSATWLLQAIATIEGPIAVPPVR